MKIRVEHRVERGQLVSHIAAEIEREVSLDVLEDVLHAMRRCVTKEVPYTAFDPNELTPREG